MSDVETDDAKPRRWQHDFLVGVLGDLEALLGDGCQASEWSAQTLETFCLDCGRQSQKFLTAAGRENEANARTIFA